MLLKCFSSYLTREQLAAFFVLFVSFVSLWLKIAMEFYLLSPLPWGGIFVHGLG